MSSSNYRPRRFKTSRMPVKAEQTTGTGRHGVAHHRFTASESRPSILRLPKVPANRMLVHTVKGFRPPRGITPRRSIGLAAPAYLAASAARRSGRVRMTGLGIAAVGATSLVGLKLNQRHARHRNTFPVQPTPHGRKGNRRRDSRGRFT